MLVCVYVLVGGWLIEHVWAVQHYTVGLYAAT